MTLEPEVAALFAVTTGAGFLMILSGLQKSMLELRGRRRTCPSCGKHIERRVCAACTTVAR